MPGSENPKLPSQTGCFTLWRNPCCQSHRCYIIHLPTRKESKSYSLYRRLCFTKEAKRISCPLKLRVGRTQSRWAACYTYDRISWGRRYSTNQGPLWLCKSPCLLKFCSPWFLGCETQLSCSSFEPSREAAKYALDDSCLIISFLRIQPAYRNLGHCPMVSQGFAHLSDIGSPRSYTL